MKTLFSKSKLKKLVFLLFFFPILAFSQTSNDAGITNITEPTSNPASYVYVQVTLTNFGGEPLSRATIHWSVNGVPQNPYSLSSFALQSGDSYDLYIGGYTFVDGEDYTITAYTEAPNGVSDDDTSNDSYTITLTSSGSGNNGSANADAGITDFLTPQIPTSAYSLVQVTLTNLGSVPLEETDIRWVINGEEQLPYHYIGPTLAPGESYDLYIGAYVFDADATYDIEVFTDNPNGGSDVNPANDGLTYTLNGNLNLYSLDAGISLVLEPVQANNGLKLVRARLKNYGSQDLENVTINWQVNGVTQTPYQFTGPTLNSCDEMDLYIGHYQFDANTNYVITIYTSNPNGGTDSYLLNDAASLVF